jgi:hypothetical protein
MNFAALGSDYNDIYWQARQRGRERGKQQTWLPVNGTVAIN